MPKVGDYVIIEGTKVGASRREGNLVGIVGSAWLGHLAGQVGRRRILQSLGLLGLYVIQTILPSLDPDLPAAAALHPVNALVMFGLGFWYARQVWRERVVATT